jgi:Protein of unknown function DUF58
MHWSNQIWIKPLFKTLVLFSPLILIFGFYREISFLFALGSLIMFLYGATLLQFKSASKELELDTSKQVYRLFPGDSDTFYIKLLHKGKWPSFRGELILTYKDIILEKNDGVKYAGSKGRIELKRPFAISQRTSYTQSIPFEAKKRGTTRISNVSIHVYDPLQIGGQALTYQRLFPAEIIVYPEPLPVYRIEQLFYQGNGEAPQPFALFENDSMPAGNRDYASGDSFNKLHWKATARTGNLQTKVFERTVVYHWTFVYTIQPDHKDMKSSDDIEREISYLAYMCQFAAEKGIPFEVYINFKVPGPFGMFHVTTGSGAQHLSIILEGLARIDRSNVTVKPQLMWVKMDRNFAGTVPFIIMLGSIPNDQNTKFMMKKWIKSGGEIFYVNQNGSEAYLMPYSSQEVVPC